MSCGLEVEKRILNLGFTCATLSNKFAKFKLFSFSVLLAFLKSFLAPPPNHK